MKTVIRRVAIIVSFLLGYGLIYLPWLQIKSDVTFTPILHSMDFIDEPNAVTSEMSTVTFWQTTPTVMNCPARIEWKAPETKEAFQNYNLLGHVAFLSVAGIGAMITVIHRKETLGVSRRVIIWTGLLLALISVVALAIIFPTVSCQPPATMTIREVSIVPFTVLIWLTSLSLGIYSLAMNNRHG